jgi:hypothetical protein
MLILVGRLTANSVLADLLLAVSLFIRLIIEAKSHIRQSLEVPESLDGMLDYKPLELVYKLDENCRGSHRALGNNV